MHSHQWEQLSCISDAALCLNQDQDKAEALTDHVLSDGRAGKYIASLDRGGLRGIVDKSGSLRDVAPLCFSASAQRLVVHFCQGRKILGGFTCQRAVYRRAPSSETPDIVLLSAGPHVTEKGGTTHPASQAIRCHPEWLLRHIRCASHTV